MKVLLVYPHDCKQGNYHSVPVGILYIHSMLREHGIDCRWVDGNVIGFDGIQKEIDTYRPDIVGVASLTLGRHRAIEVAQYAFNKYNIFVILGGPHVSIIYEQTLKHYSFVSACCTGPGEYAMLALAQGKAYPFIPSFAWREGNKIVHTTEKMDYELDDLPYPRWAEVPWQEYFSRKMGGGRAVWSRGCKWGKCIFCAVDPVWKCYRVRSPENMVGELWELTGAMLPHIGYRTVSFADDLFSGDLERTKDLLRLMIDQQINIAFDVTTRVDFVDLELIQLLKQAGCYEIRLGIETAHPEALKLYAKGQTLASIERCLAWCKQVDLRVCALLIYQGIRWREFDPFTRNWAHNIGLGNVGSANDLQIFPGTPLYNAMIDHGFFNEDFWLTSQAPYGVYLGELDHLTPSDWAKYHA